MGAGLRIGYPSPGFETHDPMDTPPPIPAIADRPSMTRLARALDSAGFTEAGCSGRLGLDPVLGIPFHRVRDGRLGPLILAAARTDEGGVPDWLRWSASDDPIDVLIGLLLANERVPLPRLERVLTAGQIALLEVLQVVTVADGAVQSALNVFPIAGRLVVTDRPGLQAGINPVSCLYPESYLLAHFIDRERAAGQTLDLCTGSGVHAILASSHSARVTAVDVNPRATAFAEFNGALNGVGEGIEVVLGDLYEPCAPDARYDLITANPPYVPSQQHAAGANWFSGGPSGEEVLARVLGGLREHLSERGIAHVYAMLIHQEGLDYRDKIAAWLGGLDPWDVTIRAVPFPFHSTEPRDPPATGHEVGLITVRHRRPGHPPRYRHGPSPDLFPLFTPHPSRNSPGACRSAVR